jgi:uncharacterized protein (TIGR03067 family)
MLSALLICAGLGLPAVFPYTSAQQELEKLQGVWNVQGIKDPLSYRMTVGLASEELRFIVAGNEYSLNYESGTFHISPTKGCVDFRITSGPFKGMTRLGRYEFRGDQLFLAIGDVVPANRPKGFTGVHDLVFIYARTPGLSRSDVSVLLQHWKKTLDEPFIGEEKVPSVSGNGQDTQKLILQKLESIEKRLSAIEKKLVDKK